LRAVDSLILPSEKVGPYGAGLVSLLEFGSQALSSLDFGIYDCCVVSGRILHYSPDDLAWVCRRLVRNGLSPPTVWRRAFVCGDLNAVITQHKCLTNHRIRRFRQARQVRGTSRAILNADQFNVRPNLSSANAASMRPLEKLVKVLAWSGGSGWFGGIIYFFCLQGWSPPTPRPLLGNIVQENSHGYYFYVTVAESRTLDALLWGSVAILVLAAGINIRMQPFKPRAPKA
jgi:hypothetical protein